MTKKKKFILIVDCILLVSALIDLIVDIKKSDNAITED